MTDGAMDIGGYVKPGFERVREAFVENFERRDELGAACAAVYRGELVVDLWGGRRDVKGRTPWTEDTLVLMFSATKGVAAATLAHAHARGLFGYDDRVADHWPEFARNGKGGVTVRTLLAHQAGLAAMKRPVTPALISDQTGLMKRLARKRPDWRPGRWHGYHAWSLGWYASELIRRTDPAGRSLGAYFAEEIAGPLGLEFYFGAPEAVAPRIAEIKGFGLGRLIAGIGGFPPAMVLALANPWSLTTRALSPFAISSPAELNDPAYRRLEIPAGGGIGQVRDVARLYGCLAADPGAAGLDAATAAALRAPPEPPRAGCHDQVLKTETAFSLGFWKPAGGFAFGSPQAFGAPGAGGAFAFADPARRLGFAYAPNRMGVRLWDDPRELALRRAVEASV